MIGNMASCAGMVVSCALLTSCLSGNAPVADHSTVVDTGKPKATVGKDRVGTKLGSHLIKRGDTLYAIAWHYGLDFRRLANWNNLTPPYLIYAGRALRLRPPVPEKRAKTSTTPQPPSGREAVATTAPVVWAWPLRNAGKIKDQGSGRLLLATVHGQEVYAAASGNIVYSGSGVRGYGKLVIIKHNEEFLSAYGNNSNLLVSEGEKVALGQKIAKAGSAPGESPALYFEIRHNGKKIDTLDHLPPQR